MTPVIFIPGLTGTKLVEINCTPFDTIWSGSQKFLEWDDLNRLALGRKTHRSVRYDTGLESLIRPGEVEEWAYGEFLKSLRRAFRHQATPKPVYIFNYDWRQSAATNATVLNEFIGYLQQKAEAHGAAFEQFDFVAHSLGNAVFRAYIQTHGVGLVGRVVFIAPPFRGSLAVARTAVMGGWGEDGLFPNVNHRIRKLIRTFPGALELLPSYDTAAQFDSSNSTFDFFNPDHWQANVADPNAQNGDPDKIALVETFRSALADASKTVNNELAALDNLDEETRSRMLVIAKSGYKTIQSIFVRPNDISTRNLFDFKNNCSTKDGDGRVTSASSCGYYDRILTLDIEDDFDTDKLGHGFMCLDDRVQRLAGRFLQRNTTSPTWWNIPGGSVRRVKGLNKQSRNGLPYWQIINPVGL